MGGRMACLLSGDCTAQAGGERVSHKRDRGQDLVEYALLFPLIMLLILGLIEFGVILYSYATITNAAREGVRHAVVDEDNPAWKVDAEAYVRERAMAVVQCQPLDVAFPPVATPGYASIDVTCHYRPLFGLIVDAVGGHSELRLHTVATMRFE